MLLTASRRAAPPIASAACARHPFGPALSHAASVAGALVPLAALSAPLADITTAAISAALNKTLAIRKMITIPFLLVISDSSMCRGSSRRRSIRRRRREFESQDQCLPAVSCNSVCVVLSGLCGLSLGISVVKKKPDRRGHRRPRRVRRENSLENTSALFPCPPRPNLLIFSVRSLIRSKGLNARHLASRANPFLPLGGSHLRKPGPGRELLHLRQH